MTGQCFDLFRSRKNDALLGNDEPSEEHAESSNRLALTSAQNLVALGGETIFAKCENTARTTVVRLRSIGQLFSANFLHPSRTGGKDAMC
jgi:hypothetical protein